MLLFLAWVVGTKLANDSFHVKSKSLVEVDLVGMHGRGKLPDA